MDGFSVAGIAGGGEPPPEFVLENGRNTVKAPIQLIDFGA
jgi:hypothetical protein